MSCHLLYCGTLTLLCLGCLSSSAASEARFHLDSQTPLPGNSCPVSKPSHESKHSLGQHLPLVLIQRRLARDRFRLPSEGHPEMPVRNETIKPEAATGDVTAPGIKDVNNITWSELRAANKFDFLVTFYAPWCPDCQTFVMSENAPINALSATLEKFNGPKVLTFDIDASTPPLVIDVIPTIYLFKQTGEEVPFKQEPEDMEALVAFALGKPAPFNSPWAKAANVSLLSQPAGAPPNRKQFHFGSISITVWCVMWLSMIMLAVHVLLATMRNSFELSEGTQAPAALEILEVAAYSSPQAASLCCLFVACRMYVLASTGGAGNPPTWVRGCMVLATAGLTLQLVLAILIRSLVRPSSLEGVSIAARVGDPASAHLNLTRQQFLDSNSDSNSDEGAGKWYLACAMQLLAALGIYGGAGGAVVGIFTFGNPLAVSSAVVCVVLVVTLFLISQASLALCTASAGPSGAPAGVRAAAAKAKKAPMIAVFFLAVRMRNLQIDPPDGFPDLWVQISCYVVVLGMSLEMLASLCTPSRSQADSQGKLEELMKELQLEGRLVGSSEADERANVEDYSTSPSVRHSQLVAALIVFGGLAAVATSVILSMSVKQPLSPMFKVISLLSALYFGVHMLQWLASFCSGQGKAIQGTAHAATVCVSLAPLLSVLFLACRMRALQLTDAQGTPHWWAQDCMKLSVTAILMQICCCLLLPVFSGMATKVDGDGNAEFELKPLFAAYVVQIIKYVALLCIYGSGMMVCASICMMHVGMSKTMDHPDTGVKLVCQILWCLGILGLAAMLSSAKVVGFVIKWVIEGVDEHFLGVNIRVGKAALSLCRGYIFISNLVVENPVEPKFSSPALMKVGKVVLKVNLWRMLRSGFQAIEITALVLSGIEVNYEKDIFHNSNVATVVQFIQGSEAEDPAAGSSTIKPPETDLATAAVTAEDEDSCEVELHLLQLKDIAAKVWTHHGQLFSVNLGNVEEADFQARYSGKKSVLAGDIILEVLKTILNTITANAQHLGAGVASSFGKETLGKAEGGFKKLLSCLPCGRSDDRRRRSDAAPGDSTANA